MAVIVAPPGMVSDWAPLPRRSLQVRFWREVSGEVDGGGSGNVSGRYGLGQLAQSTPSEERLIQG